MKRLLVAVALVLALGAVASAAPTCWDLGLPANTLVNFNGDGVFDQTIPPAQRLDGFPAALTLGTELFGVAHITAVDSVGPGGVLWTPPAGGEMTLSFWNAVVTSSATVYEDANTLVIASTYADGARMAIIQDDSADYDSTGGPSLFDTATGDYPTVYTLPAGGAAADPDEMLFLDLSLGSCTSTLTWSKVGGAPGALISSTFDSMSVQAIGGCGMPQFDAFVKGHGSVLTLNLSPGDWFYNADVDIVGLTIPAPASLISLLTGLVCLGGYGFRKWSL